MWLATVTQKNPDRFIGILTRAGTPLSAKCFFVFISTSERPKMLYATTFRLALQIMAKDMLILGQGLRSTLRTLAGRHTLRALQEVSSATGSSIRKSSLDAALQTAVIGPTPINGTAKVLPRPLPRLLLVEGAPFPRYAFAKILRLQGFEVSEASDATEALERLEVTPPQILLVDLESSTDGGLHLIEQVRATSEGAAMLIIGLMPSSDAQLIADAKRLGADEVVTKPVDLPTLVNRLNKVLPSRP